MSVVNFVLVAVCRRGFCGRSVVVVFWSYVFVEVVAVAAVVVVFRVVVVACVFCCRLWSFRWRGRLWELWSSWSLWLMCLSLSYLVVVVVIG